MGVMERFTNSTEQMAVVERILASPRNRLGALITCVVVLVLFMHSVLGISYLPELDVSSDGLRSTDGAIRKDTWLPTSHFDIVVSHYDEDLSTMRDTITQVSDRLPTGKSRRVIVYHKGGRDEEGVREILDMADEVVVLPNVGREGETYLSHIVRHYDTPSSNLAGHTIFMQPHLAWHWVFLPRLEQVLTAKTGFLSFGPYITHTCGHDSTGQDFPRMKDIYSIFRADLCPPTPVLATWAGQFIVSRERILENQFRAYDNLRSVFHASPEHWIWKEGWWNDKPSNPTLGHALERSWPMIFNCTDPRMDKECGEKADRTKCQCLD